MGRRWLRLAGVVPVLVLTLVLLAAPARAADDDEGPFREPGIQYLERRKPYIEWIAGSLIVLACLLVAFKNPHRTHLD